ncbi:MAG: hypothetical protein HYX53_08255 [Chloroflexi bacterium]|nr:hypothetical protein [Chloroflexota bacterium]
MAMDNTNHNLLHTLSVRLDTRWHHGTYDAEAACPGCHSVFAKLRELDDEAIQLLTNELASHVRANKFPVDLTD